MRVKNFAGGYRFFRVALVALSVITTVGVVIAQQPEKIESLQQGIVSGQLISAAEQEKYGLVTLTVANRGCSGALLRNDWVVTAAHCVDDDDPTKRGVFTPVADNSVTVTGDWGEVQERRSLRIISFRPHDVAIIRLDRPFKVNGSTTNYSRDIFREKLVPLLYELMPVAQSGPVQIKAYGRGIHQFARGSGESAVESQQDGQFRVGNFTIMREKDNLYWYKSAEGQHIAGGDSGGPSFTTVRGSDEVIFGVHALCKVKCVPFKFCGGWSGSSPAPAGYSPWMWVADTPECGDAPLAPAWDDINRYLGAFVTPSRYVGSNDFNGDGRGDILWHNASTGESQIWFMNGSSRVGRATILDGARPTRIGPPWGIVGSRDFNGDGKTDLLWHNASTGETQIWHMDGYKFVGRATVLGQDGRTAFVGLPWRIVGTNDMNGDKKTDIVWHNASTGETQIWQMDGHRVVGRATILGDNGQAAFVGLPWTIVGTNDFNRDGKPDLLWHNSATDETQIWYVNANRVSKRETVFNEGGTAIFVGLPWRIVGTNDFNQDGAADILWHNGSTGEMQIWLMIERSIVRRVTVDAARDGGSAAVGPPWSIMNH